MPTTIETIYSPSDDITDIINRGLHEHNLSVLGPDVIYNYAKMAIVSRDENNQIVAGLIGLFIWGALKIDTLWVDQSQRGGSPANFVETDQQQLPLLPLSCYDAPHAV